MKKIQIFPLLLSLIFPIFAGAIGGYFTYPSITSWYAYLQKPFFNPPNWIFGPVWSLLYILMGISCYLVWVSKAKPQVKQRALSFYFIQLQLNLLWSLLFFGLQSPVLGFLEVVIFWYMILRTIGYFKSISKTAALLLYPYIAWVSFAMILNLSILILNK